MIDSVSFHAYLKKIAAHIEPRYRHFFSIEEIENTELLKWMFGASLLYLYAIFNVWISSSMMTVETARRGTAECWPYFQDCYQFFFLHALPAGYSQSIFYMTLMGVMIAIVWLMWRGRWSAAHALLLLLFIWEVLVNFVFSYSAAAPYNYYHIALTAILLFVPFKEFFLKFGFVFMYFMSVTVKIDSTWILGTYFTALKTGLPIFPDALIPVFTNIVIFMQMIGCWFLLSRNMVLQRLSLIYFLTFHFYSGVFVMYLYPTVSLPPLFILFGPMYRHTPIPFSRKAFAGLFIIFLLTVFQVLGFMAPGDRRITLEGNKFGMFMFEANHQCVVTVKSYGSQLGGTANFEARPGTPCIGLYCMVKSSTRTEGGVKVQELRYESSSAWNRCYPYDWWSRLHSQCTSLSKIQRISLEIDHSINGGPFYEIVNVPDICDLPYHTFGPNDWVKGPPEAPIVGYPVENTYHY